MECPQCGARTQVNEKRGPFRDRRCTNPACRAQFTTREQIMLHREGGKLCARTRAIQIETSEPPAAGNVAGPDLGEAAGEEKDVAPEL
jgi:hypothetical protein